MATVAIAIKSAMNQKKEKDPKKTIKLSSNY